MDHFSLKWSDYLNEVTDAFHCLRSDEELVDVTISCEGRKLKAHKVILSACSNYFRDIFKENPCQHPVIVFRNVKFIDLEAIVEYIYRGEVSVIQTQLESFLGIAELLEVKGLSEGPEKEVSDEEGGVSKGAETRETVACAQPLSTHKPSSPPLKKRKISQYEDVQEPPSTEQSPLIELKTEPDEYIEDVSYVEDDTNDDNTELLPTLNDPTPDSSSKCDSLQTLQVKEELMRDVPTVVEQSFENEHKLVNDVTKRFCIICAKDKTPIRKISNYWCPGCNCGVHPLCYHKLKHFWRPSTAVSSSGSV